MRSAWLAFSLMVACHDDTPEDTPSSEARSAEDLDGDGFSADQDCDDLDPTRSPAMPEVPYDGRDNDCDPATADDDGDGDGVPLGEDCDDSDPGAWADDHTLIAVDTVEAGLCDGYCTRRAARVTVPADATDLTYLRCLTEIEELMVQGADRLVSLRGLERLTGAGQITLADLPALTDASALAGLAAVGSLHVSDAGALTEMPDMPALASLAALEITDSEGLQRIGALPMVQTIDQLTIVSNPALEAMPAMAALQVVAAELKVTGNGKLTDLAGLEGLGVVEGDLIVAGNPALVALDGLDGLGSVLDDATITDNEALASVEALAGLQRIGVLTLSELPSLDSLEGLHNLTWADRVTVMGTGATDLSGLRALEAPETLTVHDNPQLVTVGEVDWQGELGELIVTSNEALADLDGLEGAVAFDALTLTDNPRLEGVAGLAGVMDIDGAVTITDNASLAGLRGLASLSSVGAITIQGNPVLADIGWDRLVRSRGVTIADNPALELSGSFWALQEVAGDLLLANNDGMEGAGFSALEEVGGDLMIQDNDALASIGSLSALEVVSGDVLIWGNAQMTDAAAAAVADAIPSVAGVVVVDANGAGL